MAIDDKEKKLYSVQTMKRRPACLLSCIPHIPFDHCAVIRGPMWNDALMPALVIECRGPVWNRIPVTSRSKMLIMFFRMLYISQNVPPFCLSHPEISKIFFPLRVWQSRGFWNKISICISSSMYYSILFFFFFIYSFYLFISPKFHLIFNGCAIVARMMAGTKFVAPI